MPVSEITRLRAKAGALKIADYRTLGADELKAAIASANSGEKPRTNTTSKKAPVKATKAAPVKATKTAPAAAKAESKAAVKKVSPSAKKATPKAQKAAAKQSPPAEKSTSQKSSSEAAKGKAKRETATTTPAATTRVHATQPGHVGKGGYTNLDRGAIDWTVESNVAQSGKRKDVLDALRKHKGDYALAFEHLRDHAEEFFPTALNTYPKSGTKKAAAERMLRWIVARVAYDFAYKTGQHVGRAASKTKKAAPKKTATKATTAKTPRKAAGAAQKPAKAKPAAKSTPAKPRAQKAAPKAGAKLPATAKARQSTPKRGAR